jgi:putative nucleotidyltransferase with HDIG domain
MDFGCASYCKYAEQCIGNLPPELLAQKEDLLKDRVAIEMKRYFKQDFRRIGHAARVARYAEQIGKEMSANLAVILPAAYLHDIGIKEAEEKHPNGSSVHHETEGPPIAKEILEGLGAHEELINDVCGIIGHHHHPKPKEPREYQAVYDADLIANLEDDHKDSRLHRDHIEKAITQSFLTKEGRDLAKKVLLG